MGARKIHHGDEPCRRDNRFDHFALDICERFTELLPVPGRAAWARGLPIGRIMVDEVDVVSVPQRQGRIPQSCHRSEGRLAAIGYFGRHKILLITCTDASKHKIHRRRIGAPSSASAGHPHRGVSMPTVIGHHDVKDQKHWLASPKREEVFGPLGITNIRTFIDPQNATRVAVLMDVPDMDALNAAMQNPAMAEAMAYDGVVAETLVVLVEA